MSGKSIELLKEVAPRITRAAYVHNPQTLPGGSGSPFLRSFEAAASSIGLETVAALIDENNSVESVLSTLGREAGCGLFVSGDIFTSSNAPLIIDLSARYLLPAAYMFRRFTAAGGLMSYGVDPTYPFREAAAYIDRILKGTNPGDLPVQLPTKFHIAINLKAAKAIGLTVPESFLLRADEVIE
jgi:putative ABC transport system substrate-binding protein